MKTNNTRRLLTLALALLMCLSLIPAALAASTLVLNVDKTILEPGEGFTTNVSGIGSNDNPNNIICVAMCPVGEPYHANIYGYDFDLEKGTNFLWHRGTGTSPDRYWVAPNNAGRYELRLFANGEKPAETLVMTIELIVGGGGAAPTPTPTPTPTTPPASNNPWSKASSWAVPELEKAKNLGLIPASLNGTDFTKAINRAEFAAVSVKL
ncbi:MAG: hypothetical protein LBN99_01820, partial [Oscillospiraceae bacterium]|nr:hypothetical protein [Oscillospiraceae bacterium]